jgi:mannitol-1-phosphate 5-dehydrogenase
MGGYLVRLIDGAHQQEITVDGITALDSRQTSPVANVIAAADLVVISVRPANFATVAPLLARGLAEAQHPVNVIVCENLPDAGPRMRHLVAKEIDSKRHGFSGAVVDRAVSHRLFPTQPDQPVVLVGDPVDEFAVDIRALVAPLPPIRGLIPVEDYEAWYRRKLYRYSAGHATAAYLGNLKGYQYVHVAVQDPEIRAVVRAAMAEGQAGLRAVYGGIAGSSVDLDAMLHRFGNAGLADTVRRVARDPRRKLGPDDRLIGPAQLAIRAGVSPTALAQAAAAALCFWDPEDASSVTLGRWLDHGDVAGVLGKECGLEPDSEVFSLIVAAWDNLASSEQEDNLLLSLDRRRWAWAT